jgi:beta-phosphoglucomutase-like phosphatase (HAD superfamily)
MEAFSNKNSNNKMTASMSASPESEPPTPPQVLPQNNNDDNDDDDDEFPIQGVIFDMDGTLLDSETLGCQAVYLALQDQMSLEARRAFCNRGYRMEWPLKRQTLGLPGPQWATIVLEWAQQHWGVQQPPTVDEFLQSWDHHMSQHMHTIEACKGAKELVQRLASMQHGIANKSLPLAIATSSHSQSVAQKRVRHEDDLFRYMSAIVSTDDPAVKHGKPAPDIYWEAAKRLQVDPRRCIVFEDGLPGVQAGKAAGCFVIAVPADARCYSSQREKDDELFATTADMVLQDLTQFDWNVVVEAVLSKQRRQQQQQQQQQQQKEQEEAT